MPNRRRRRAGWIWPGLPWLWNQGSWAGLVLAVAFAVLVNILFIASVVWTEWMDRGIRRAGWLAAATIWCGAAIASRQGQAAGDENDPLLNDPESGLAVTEGREAAEDLFRKVITQYLQGNWYETQCGLEDLIRQNPRDVAARLMHATMCRHLGRTEEAARRLAGLTSLPEARAWQHEIERERRWLSQGPTPSTREVFEETGHDATGRFDAA